MARYRIAQGACMHYLDGRLAFPGDIVEWDKPPLSDAMVRLADETPTAPAEPSPEVPPDDGSTVRPAPSAHGGRSAKRLRR